MIVVAVLSVSSLLGNGLTSESKQHGRQPDSTIGLELIQDRMTGPQKVSEFVIVRSAAHTARDPAYKACVNELAGEIAGLDDGIVEGVETYYQTQDPTLVFCLLRQHVLWTMGSDSCGTPVGVDITYGTGLGRADLAVERYVYGIYQRFAWRAARAAQPG